MVSSPQLKQTLRQFVDMAVHYSMRASGHFVKAMGLSMPQFSLLMQLHYRGICGMSEVVIIAGDTEDTPKTLVRREAVSEASCVIT